MEAFYRCSPGSKGDPKSPWLDRLKADGVFLIDLVPFPINALASDKREAERLRRKARKDHVAVCIEEVRSHDPAGVIICHDGVHMAAATKMRAAGLPLLHDESIPFPLYGGVQSFPVAVRAALTRLR